MAVKGKGRQEPQVCSMCGGDINADGECTICGQKQASNPSAMAGRQVAPELSRDEALKLFKRIEGIGEARANSLYDAGFTSLEALRAASIEDIVKLTNLDEKLAKNVHEVAAGIIQSSAKPGGSDDALVKWLSSDNGDAGLSAWLGGGVAAPKQFPAPNASNVDALKKWLSGEESALEEWLGFETAPTVAAEADISRKIRELERLIEEKDLQLARKERDMDGMKAEIDELKDGLQRQLSAFKNGTFDPVKFIEDQANLNKQLQVEASKRRQLEEEMEHLKKGSIAVIKYLKSQQQRTAGASPEVKKRLAEETVRRQELEAEVSRLSQVGDEFRKQIEKGLQALKPNEKALKERELSLVEKEAHLRAKEEQLAAFEEMAKRGEIDIGGASEELQQRLQEELREKEKEFHKKEEELNKRVIVLEEELSKYQIDEKLRKEAAELKGKSKEEVDVIVARKSQDLLAKEKSILIREQEIHRLKEELQLKEDEMKKLTEPMKYKEEELLRREEDLLYRERLLQAQLRKMEEAKAQGGSTEELELKERLEQLKAEIATKEEEVRAKEKYLKVKMEELRLREQGLIEEEIDAREEDRSFEIKQDKAKTGTPRLDDLLLGGIPFGSNVSIYGPAYVGKEVLVNAFMAEGLKKGLPVIWVITDKTPADIREDMKFLLPGYEEYEKLGLVKYVDAYSRSMGSEEQDPHTTYITDATDHESILRAVDDIAKEHKQKHPYYRLAFRSISTLIAYMDPTTTFKFLQPFAGRRKRDKAISMYVIEKGMHEEQEIQMLGSVMDGSIEFKVEQLKSYLAVKGVGDVQSRTWIRYTYSKQAMSIGSFSLDHIK